MIRDLDDAPPEVLEYDVCVVGSGPAGGTVANELVGSGLRVVVLESGRLKTTPYGDRLREVRSEGIHIKDYSRERVLGGASTTWAGLSSPLDRVDLEARPYLRHSGWPITREDLLPYYRRAARAYRFPQLSMFDGGVFAEIRAGGEFAPSWERVEEKVFLAAAEPQNFGRELRHIYQRDVDLLLDATVIRLESAPQRSAQDTPLASGDGAPASSSAASSSSAAIRTTVCDAVVRSSTGAERRVRARVFVLGTGGIENARLLLQSVDACPTGLGNENDQVGRFLMNHPKNYHGILTLAKPVREVPYYFGCLLDGFAGYGGLRLREEEQRSRGLLNSYVRMEPLYPWSDNPGVEALVLLMKRSKFILRAWRAGRRGQVTSIRDYSETGDDSDLQNQRKTLKDWIRLPWLILSHLPAVVRYGWSRTFARRAPRVTLVRLRNFMEMEPDPENRITLCDETDPLGQRMARVRHRSSDLDRRSLSALHDALRLEVERNGLGRLDTTLADLTREEESWPIHEDASHHLGATRMGNDPTCSVTNVNARVHSVANVYVAGGSLFPTSGCANPTFTIVALSIRLADHLKREVFQVQAATSEPEPGGGATDDRKNVLIVGSGRRVLEAALPVFAAAGDRYRVAAICARKARTVRYGGREYEVVPLDSIQTLEGIDLVYVAASKPAVPGVLRHLAGLDPSDVDLLVDTPVVLFKHLGHADLALRFRNAWVAEDCVELPWIDLVRRAEQGPLGRLHTLHFERAAWRYHGFAMMKELFSGTAIRSGRRVREAPDRDVFELSFEGDRVARMVEPRDYDHGHFTLVGERASVSDAVTAQEGVLQLRMLQEGGAVVGIGLGDDEVRFDETERMLVGTEGGETVTSWMEGLKRVGFLRLLRRIDRGDGAWPLIDGLEDMTIEYLLEKTGRYAPWLGVRRSLLRFVMRAVSRVRGG